jgi:hypothetical protein
MTAPACPYCGSASRLVTGADVYPRRTDLADKKFYRCPTCPDAWVGCHPGTDTPLGRLADARLRLAKQAAHAAFDPLWQAKAQSTGKKGSARGKGYAWLAAHLGIPVKDCHIGMMDAETCLRVVQICKERKPAPGRACDAA